ncbi:MAG: ATP-dependent DNA ligase, partial [Candidatus Micrarchaeota archaeon]|nr:ATP-dependent DNA ligase [Candidatus Micrarchaeota archaeon]
GDKSMREELERAYNLCSDLGLVAKTLFTNPGEIANFKVKLFSPIRPALAERLPTAEEIIKKIGKCSVEAKYDGFRCQVHKKGGQIELFSRKLERTTRMFPEIVEAAKQLKATDLILEGEALAYSESTGQYYSFQFTIQRKRKHGIDAMAEQFPLRLFAFDLLYADGEDYTRKPYSERRKALAGIVGKKGGVIQLSDAIITDKAKELENYFNDSVSKGLEGIIAKDLNSPYVAGARKFAWIKLKRSYQGELADTVDVVIVGYYLGKGKRAEFEFGGLLCAVYDSDEDRFKTIARIGSGFSEEQMKNLQELLSKTKTGVRPPRLDSKVTPDFWVEPKFVITVSADEITRSPMHTCGMSGNTGYALRFPRMVGDIRTDKSPEDATTVSEILQMFDMQKKTSLE